MQDRNVQFPQRYKLQKVAGTDDIYDLIPTPGEISSEGTFLNKANLLKDVTASIFGLSNEAVPDDVFAFLGKYNQHWWGRRVNSENGGYVAKTTWYSPGGTTFLSYWGKVTITASAQYEVDLNTGEITLLNPVTVVSDANSGNLTEAQVNSLRGKYCKGLYCTGSDGDTDRILFLEQDAAVEWRWNSSSTKCGVRVNSGLGPELVSKFVSNKMIGEWDYMYNADRNAFPDSGVVSGYEYNYLGIPFDNAVTAPKIETGSYVGTNKSGANNPNSLTFGFAPKLLIFSPVKTGYYAIMAQNSQWYALLGTGISSSCFCSFSGNTVTWYCTQTSNGAFLQLNGTGESYNYIAIG